MSRALVLALALIFQEREAYPGSLEERVAQLAGQGRCDEAHEVAGSDDGLQRRVDGWCEPAPVAEVALPSAPAPRALLKAPVVVRPPTVRPKPVARQSRAAAARPAAGKFTCATVHQYCREMHSCAEARFGLKHCGMSELDRDGDGVPCENICPGG